jgi:hypothetical protein
LRSRILIVLSRQGSLAVVDPEGRENEKYPIIYGGKLFVNDGQTVTRGQELTEWDNSSTPIITEIGGRLALGNIINGLTVKEEIDETTGLPYKVVIAYAKRKTRPRISIKDEQGRATLKLPGTNVLARYLLPAGTRILVKKGDVVAVGDVLAVIPRNIKTNRTFKQK